MFLQAKTDTTLYHSSSAFNCESFNHGPPPAQRWSRFGHVIFRALSFPVGVRPAEHYGVISNTKPLPFRPAFVVP